MLVLTFAFSSANGNHFVPTCSNSADYTSWGGEVDLITSNPHVNIGRRPKVQTIWKFSNLLGGVRTIRLPASACLQVFHLYHIHQHHHHQWFIMIIMIIIISNIMIMIMIIRLRTGKSQDGRNVFIVFAALTRMSFVKRVAHRCSHRWRNHWLCCANNIYVKKATHKYSDHCHGGSQNHHQIYWLC